MRNSLILLLLSVCSVLNAKDIIYTISAEYNGQNVSVDSVMFENLSFGSSLVFTNLNSSGVYSFDLGAETELGVSSQESISFYKVLKNVPGEIVVQINRQIPKIHASLYNVKGQVIDNKTISLTDSRLLTLQIPNNTLYILKLESELGSSSIKVIGVNKIVQFNAKTIAYNPQELKSSVSSLEKNSFQTGDSMRVTVFKKDKFVYPKGVIVQEKDSLHFVFHEKTADSTGVSNTYVTNLSADSIDFVYNQETNASTMNLIDSKDLQIGSILTIDMDTMGILQKVVAIDDNNGQVSVIMAPVYMDELFVNKSFKLSTALLETQNTLKSAYSNEELEEALTDSAGFIHPCKVIYHTKNGAAIEKSALAENDGSFTIIDSYNDLSGISFSNNTLVVEDGYLNVKLNAVFEFDFEYQGELTEDTKVEKGELETFKFYLDGRADFKTKLALNMSGAGQNEDNSILFDLESVTAKFIVGAIPIWVTMDCDIMQNHFYNATADVHADWGFESHHALQVGGIYIDATDRFEPLFEYTSNDSIYPLHANSEVDAAARFEVYPRIDAMFYSFFGPYAEIAPFIQGNYKSNFINTTNPNGEDETFLAWNSGIDLGLDFRTGTQLSFLFWGDEIYGPEVLNCFEYSWFSPVELQQNYLLPEEAEKDDLFPLEFEVLDNKKGSAEFCQVYITGDGEFNKYVDMTDELGKAHINWTVSDTGYNAFTAVVYNADGTENLSYSDSVYVIAQKPIVETVSIDQVTHESAVILGNIINTFNNPIIDHGFYYGTEKDPDSTGTKFSVSSDSAFFSGVINGLNENTIYYLKAYAISSAGTGVGNEMTFKTESTESNLVYGQQIWMKKNMNVDIGSDYCRMFEISNYPDPSVFIDDPNYGLLYNWDGAQKVCPEGWHIPTDADWTKLANYLADNGYNYDGTIGGGAQKIAKAMASKTTDWTKSPEGDYKLTDAVQNSPGINSEENNASGFNAYPGGFWYDGSGQLYCTAMWWTSTTGTDNNIFGFGEDSGICIRGIDIQHTGLFRRVVNGYNDDYSWMYFSVRCIKDALLPAVSTSDIKTFADNEVMLRGTVDDEGSSMVQQRGVAIGITKNFNVNICTYVEADEGGTGPFEVIVNGLDSGTYYFKAFAVNEQGITFGQEMEVIIE